VAILTSLTGLWQVLLRVIFDNYIIIINLYFTTVILNGCYYFYVHKEKEGIGLFGTTILDCAAIIATFYTGISYFSELYFNFGGFLLLLSEEYLPFMMANAILLYWSLNKSIGNFRMTFYEKGATIQ